MPDPIIGTLTLPGGAVQSASCAIPQGVPDPSWTRFDGQGGKTIGLHVYARASAAITQGTVQLSNGALNPDGSGFCGVVKYDSLKLRAPAGMEWVVLPQKGEAVSGAEWTIAAKPGSGSHIFRAKQIMQRPFALVAIGNAAGKARAAAHLRYQALEFPPVVTNYGPTMSTQPAVNRAMYEMQFAQYAGQLLEAQKQGGTIWIDGVCGIERPAYGPLWMDGQGEQGAPGGFEIDMSHGYEQCRSSVLCHAITFRANLARQFCAMFNAQTGKPMSMWEWTKRPECHHMDNEPGMESVFEFACFTDGNWRYKRFNSGQCNYESELAAYQGHDMAHGIRFMEDAVPLIEYTNDRAVKDALLMATTYWATLHWSNRADDSLDENEFRPSLTRAFDRVSKKPHRAGWFDRNYGWACYAGACVIKYLPAGALRDAWVEWGKKMLETGLLAADKFGFTMREQRDELPQGVHGLITFHEGINTVGMFALGQQVGGAWPVALGPLLKQKCKSMYVDLPPLYGEYANDWNIYYGPHHWIGTEKDGLELNTLSSQHCSGGGDATHVLAACAIAHRASGSVEPLNWALKHEARDSTLQARLERLLGRTEKSNTAEMESVLEKHLGVG